MLLLLNNKFCMIIMKKRSKTVYIKGDYLWGQKIKRRTGQQKTK